MSAFLLCFAAWTALALGMDRHHADVRGRDAPLRQLQGLRGGGWLLLLLLLLSLGLAAQSGSGPASLAVTAWAVALSLAALAVTALLTWWPRGLAVLAQLALCAGVLAAASGW
jgi:hypothetical protein